MPGAATELARRLARDAEAVCRHYLSNGRRQGRYWTVGDVHNTPGRSLYVRLTGPDSGSGAAGKWADAATGQYGDLLDLIGLTRGVGDVRNTMTEARRFLALPAPDKPTATTKPDWRSRTPAANTEAARRLFCAGQSLPGTHAARYLRERGVTASLDATALRFHPNVWYRDNDDSPLQSWPALLAAVCDRKGVMSGLLRVWLDHVRPEKAPVLTPRKALGPLSGNAVWIGVAPNEVAEVLAAGEGLETMLSLRSVLPEMPVAAALSADGLAALVLDPPPVRLYIAHDNDAAGLRAAKRMRARAKALGVDVRDLAPALDDWNGDLRAFGKVGVLARLGDRLAPEDFTRFAPSAAIPS